MLPLRLTPPLPPRHWQALGADPASAQIFATAISSLLLGRTPMKAINQSTSPHPAAIYKADGGWGPYAPAVVLQRLPHQVQKLKLVSEGVVWCGPSRVLHIGISAIRHTRHQVLVSWRAYQLHANAGRAPGRLDRDHFLKVMEHEGVILSISPSLPADVFSKYRCGHGIAIWRQCGLRAPHAQLTLAKIHARLPADFGAFWHAKQVEGLVLESEVPSSKYVVSFSLEMGGALNWQTVLGCSLEAKLGLRN